VQFSELQKLSDLDLDLESGRSHTAACVRSRLPMHQIISKSQKLCGWTDGHAWVPISPCNDLKVKEVIFPAISCSSQSMKWCLLVLTKWSDICANGNQTAQHQSQPPSVHTSQFQQVHKVCCSVTTTLCYRNLSLNQSALKLMGSITVKCCWCRNCCKWSGALLHMCLSSSKTMHSWHSQASAPWHTQSINYDVWPANIT